MNTYKFEVEIDVDIDQELSENEILDTASNIDNAIRRFEDSFGLLPIDNYSEAKLIRVKPIK